MTKLWRYLKHTRTELTDKPEHSDQTEKTVQAQRGPQPPIVYQNLHRSDHKVVERQNGQHVDEEQTADVLPRDDPRLGIRDSLVVNEYDEKTDENVADRYDVADVDYRPDGVRDGVERHHWTRQNAVDDDRKHSDLLPHFVRRAAYNTESSIAGISAILRGVQVCSSEERYSQHPSYAVVTFRPMWLVAVFNYAYLTIIFTMFYDNFLKLTYD